MKITSEVDEEVVEELDNSADTIGMSRSEYIARILTVAVGESSQDPLTAILELREIRTRMTEIEENFEEFRELTSEVDSE